MHIKKAPPTLLEDVVHWLRAVIVALLIVGIIVLVFVLIPEPHYKDGFRTLTELQEHAQTLDEFIKMEGKNVFFPRYESYYQKNFAPSLWKTMKLKAQWLLTTLHVMRKPVFSESFFKTILESVTAYRKERGWTGAFIQKIEVNENSKLVVFGTTQGAFHGLIRYLEQLKNMGLINEDLKITNPDYYLIFLGNVVNRSPYTLESFSIVLRLLQRNPENVIYLKGTNEFPDYWKQHTLRRELELRVNKLSSSSIPLQHEVDTFFSTLPMTLYCTIPFLSDATLYYFKCAGFIEDERFFKLIDAPRYASFLKQNTPHKLVAFDLHNGKDNDPEANNLKSLAIVRDIRKRDSYEEMDGLRLMPPTKGITTWTVLSTAAEPYRLSIKFFYDAFVIIEPAPKQEDWKIILYNKNVMNVQNKTFQKRSFSFFGPSPQQN